MTSESGPRPSSPLRRLAALLAAVHLVTCIDGSRAAAQTHGSSAPMLRQQLEQRVDVLSVQDALVLRPKAPIRDVRSPLW